MRQSREKNLDRIRHILEAIESINSFTSGITFEEFKKDGKTYYACLFQFAVMGEAIARVDSSILERYDYPWYKVKSFRNFIMHEYHAIDEQLVWDTIELDLPGFQEMMEMIRKAEQSDHP